MRIAFHMWVYGSQKVSVRLSEYDGWALKRNKDRFFIWECMTFKMWSPGSSKVSVYVFQTIGPNLLKSKSWPIKWRGCLLENEATVMAKLDLWGSLRGYSCFCFCHAIPCFNLFHPAFPWCPRIMPRQGDSDWLLLNYWLWCWSRMLAQSHVSKSFITRPRGLRGRPMN